MKHTAVPQIPLPAGRRQGCRR